MKDIFNLLSRSDFLQIVAGSVKTSLRSLAPGTLMLLSGNHSDENVQIGLMLWRPP